MPAARPSDRTSSAALVLTAALLWGTIGPAQVLAAGSVGPAALAGWRQLVGCVALGVASSGDTGSWKRLRGRTVWTAVVLLGAIGAAYQVTFLTSVALTGAALGTVMAVAAVPVFAGVAARAFERQRLSPRWVAGSGVAVGGAALLLLPGAGDRISVPGLAAGLLAGALFAAYTLVARRLAMATAEVNAATGASMLVGTLLLVPAMAADRDGLGSLRTVALIGWLGVVTTAVAYALYARGLRRLSANVAGTLSVAEPLSAALLSTVILGERLTPTAWAACAVIFAGLLLAVPGRDTGAGEVAAGQPWTAAVGMVPMPLGIPVRPHLVGVALRPRPPQHPLYTVELPLVTPRGPRSARLRPGPAPHHPGPHRRSGDPRR